MEYLRFCCVSPHAPILVPEIARGEAGRIKSSTDSLARLASEIRETEPETIVIISPPHVRLASNDAFVVKSGERMEGSLESFPSVSVSYENDTELIDALVESAHSVGVKVVKEAGVRERDWGALVPLHLLAAGPYKLVVMNVAPYLPYQDHYRLGVSLQRAIEGLSRRTVFIASADLSHRLTKDAPYPYNPRGKEFDAAMVEIIRSGEFARLFELDPQLIDAAGEDCVWSVATLAGTMDGHSVSSEVLSYEGPFGVGYLVARVVPGEPDEGRALQRGL